MRNRFYVYKTVGDKYITIDDDKKKGAIKIGLSKNIDNAGYWNNKKSAKTWASSILYKYPDTLLTEVKFTQVNPN